MTLYLLLASFRVWPFYFVGLILIPRQTLFLFPIPIRIGSGHCDMAFFLLHLEVVDEHFSLVKQFCGRPPTRRRTDIVSVSRTF